MTETLKILLLEDNPEDAEIVMRLLKKVSPQYQLSLAMNKEAYLQALDQFQPDIILSDNNLPQFSASEALKIIQERSLLVPFILVTGTVSDEFAANIIKSGADDYILKDRLTRLPVAISAALKQRRLEKEKQEAIEQLIQSEEKYRTIFLKSPLPKWIYDYETLRFLEVNEAAINHYGYSMEEFLSMTIKDIRPKEELESFLDDLTRIEDDPDNRKNSWTHLKKNGERITVETKAHFVNYNKRKARMVVVYDVTERIEMERQKEFDRNNLSALINNTGDLMWSVDRELNLITFNDAFNRAIESISGKPLTKGDNILSSQFNENQLTRYLAFYDRALAGETFTIIDQFGFPIQAWSEISFYPIRQGDTVIGTACFSRDITQRRKAEEELRSMEKELLDQKVQEQKKVTRAIIKAQERERNHIGQELHDNVSQILVSSKMYLSMAGEKNAELKPLIKYPMELTEASIHEIRALSSTYVTPLKDIDLQELIQLLLVKLKDNSGAQNTFVYNVSNPALDDELKLNVYRIIQEQINNIVKHADAKNVSVSIETDSRAINIQVTDDGKGFDPDKKRKGIGISNMINRIESFNGEMKIETSPGNGCKTMIRMPY